MRALVAGLVYFALVFAAVMNIGSYWFSDKIVLRMYGAQEVTPADAPQLHQIVEELAHEAGIPKPRVYIVPDDSPNAFATGRNPEHAAVAVTEGLLKLMGRDEIMGVLAHELAHVKLRHMLVGTIAATMAGAIAMIARIVGEAMRDDNGKIFRLQGSFQDITPLREADEALREANYKMGLLLEYAPAALAMFDTGMRYLAVSTRWMRDYLPDAGDIIGKSHYEVFPEIGERWKEAHRRGLAGSVCRVACSSPEVSCRGIGMATGRSGRPPRDLAARPGPSLLDRLAGPRVRGPHRLEEVQNVLCARGRPQSQEPMVGVRERPAAADSDEARVTVLGENHGYTCPSCICPAVCVT